MWLILSFCLFGQIQSDSLLSQADCIAKKYNVEVAKLSPPSATPQNCLDTASVWFTIDLKELPQPAFESLQDEMLWDHLREIGVQGVHLKGLKQQTSIRLNPNWGNDWESVALALQRKGMVLIGDSMGNSTGMSTDFGLALKNVGQYPGLYHLIEIEKQDWKLLPKVEPKAGQGRLAANVPWLKLEELKKKGYVPEEFAPYVKTSKWNATMPIRCADTKVRRWIYLTENELDPVIDWLNPSFAGPRIATADILDSTYRLGEKIIQIDDSIESNAKETLALWIRKLGNCSVQKAKSIEELKNASTDMLIDTLTPPALLHALICEDTEALKLMYRLFLEEGIEGSRLVHTLQPFDQYSCDWSELLSNPKKRFTYYEENLTGEVLRARLLKEDLLSLGGKKASTWADYCSTALTLKDLEKKREDATDLHLLLAFFYAMQPGAFSFSVSDLLGTVSPQTIQLMQANENTLYASLPGQFCNGKSFAMQLKKILTIRRENSVEKAELLAVPQTGQPGLILLIHRMKETGMLQLLAVNFGRTPAEQSLEIPTIRNTTAIDLMTGLAEKKPLNSTSIRVELPPLTGKIILFQTKYFD